MELLKLNSLKIMESSSLTRGTLINAEVKMKGNSKRIIDQEAVQTLLDLSNQKDGVINIGRLSPKQVAIVASNLQHEVLFKGLSTDFTRLDKLLLRLRGEKHHGFVEVLTKEHQMMGVLFLDGGEPVDNLLPRNPGPLFLVENRFHFFFC